MMVHNALVGCGLRDHVKIGASGKVATGIDIVKRLAQGADYTNAARAMMMAVGCIQSQRCHTNECPVGVATQDPKRSRALNIPDKTERVYRYQHATVAEAQRLIASMGLRSPAEVTPAPPRAARRPRRHAAATPSCSSGSRPASSSSSRRRAGRSTGTAPTPTPSIPARPRRRR